MSFKICIYNKIAILFKILIFSYFLCLFLLIKKYRNLPRTRAKFLFLNIIYYYFLFLFLLTMANETIAIIAATNNIIFVIILSPVFGLLVSFFEILLVELVFSFCSLSFGVSVDSVLFSCSTFFAIIPY